MGMMMDSFICPIYNILSSVWLLTLKVLFLLFLKALGQTHLSTECFQYFMSSCKWLGWIRMIAGPHCIDGKPKVLINFLWVVVLWSIDVGISFVLPISIGYFISYYTLYLMITNLDKMEKLWLQLSDISLSLLLAWLLSLYVSVSLSPSLCVCALSYFSPFPFFPCLY